MNDDKITNDDNTMNDDKTLNDDKTTNDDKTMNDDVLMMALFFAYLSHQEKRHDNPSGYHLHVSPNTP